MRIDETFLDNIGLGALPEAKKKDLLARAQEELEIRIGEKMSNGLTLDQLQEFEGIMTKDHDTLVRMLAKVGDYRQDVIYDRLLKQHGVAEGDVEILSEYLSVKWVQMNRPNYAELTAEAAKEIQDEILASKNKILAMV